MTSPDFCIVYTIMMMNTILKKRLLFFKKVVDKTNIIQYNHIRALSCAINMAA